MATSDAASANDLVTVTVTVDAFGEPVALEVDVPRGPTRPRRLLPVVQALADELVAESTRRVREAGKTVSCRAGCGACCRQIVPIARTEAHAIAAVVEALPEPRRAEIRARFAAARGRLAEAGLLDRLRDLSWLRPRDAEPLALEYFALGIECPFLERGSCSIYADRPIACREYLVTSPAEACAKPTARTIEMVPLPGALSERIPDMEPKVRGAAWVPLALSTEWAASHPEEDPTRTGPELLEALVR